MITRCFSSDSVSDYTSGQQVRFQSKAGLLIYHELYVEVVRDLFVEVSLFYCEFGCVGSVGELKFLPHFDSFVPSEVMLEYILLILLGFGFIARWRCLAIVERLRYSSSCFCPAAIDINFFISNLVFV